MRRHHMAKKNTLLQDAIADAKAVRETALANARLVLEEAFTPHLTSMLSAKLRQEDTDVTGWEDEAGDAYEPAAKPQNEDMTLSSSDLSSPSTKNVTSPGPKEPSQHAQSSSDIENKGQESEPRSNTTPAISEGSESEEGEDSESNEFPPSTVDRDGSGADDWAQGEEEFGAGDLDLEAIIRELEGEAQPEEVPGEEEEVPAQNLPGQQAPGAPVSPEVPPAPDAGAPEVPSTDAPVDAAQEPAEEDDNEHNINLEAILREMDEEVVESSAVAELVAAKKQLGEVVGELKEYRKAFTILRSKLQEVNLLNAKLLFTNKLFKNYNMSGPQKMKVVETFDRTNTVREVKLVYSTLAESFNGAGTVTKKKLVSEGIASRSVASTKPSEVPVDKSTPTVITEGSEMANRFQKLAGITKRS